MVLVEKRTYRETIQILRGKKQLIPIYLELKEWLRDRFGLNAYNFGFEKIKYNNPEKRYQLYILLSSTADYNRMMDGNYCGYDRNKQAEIASKFYDLSVKYDYGKENSRKNVWICYNDFSVEIKTDINRQAYKRINKYIKDKYVRYSLWDIHTAFESVVVFFYKNIDVLKNTRYGICKMIKDDYFKALKEFDEFNVFSFNNFVMKFDSKENLDKNYDGNLYYYFK